MVLLREATDTALAAGGSSWPAASRAYRSDVICEQMDVERKLRLWRVSRGSPIAPRASALAQYA